jgi:predicted negative regulator of RcsB-dependent stress response
LTLLDVTNAGALVAETHEIRGDALFAKNDVNGARAEYQSALDAYKSDAQADVSLLQLKLTDLGVAPDASAGTAASSEASSTVSTP